MAAAHALFVYSVLCALSMVSLISYGAFAQRSRACPLGMFCRLNTNCIGNTISCDIQCPTENDPMQLGNHTTGNCERGTYGITKADSVHWCPHGQQCHKTT